MNGYTLRGKRSSINNILEVKGNDSLHQKMYISNNNIVIYDIFFLPYLDIIIYSSDLTNIVWE